MKKFVILGSMLVGVVFLSWCGQQSVKPPTSVNVNSSSTISNTLSSTTQQIGGNYGYGERLAPSAIIFRKKLTDGSYEIISSSTEKMVQWGDWVFYGERISQDDFNVFSYNTNTGEKKLIFNLQRDAHPDNSYHNPIELDGLSISNDNFYVSFSGFNAPAGTYGTHLPVTQKLKEIANNFNEMITIGGRVFVSAHGGDACVSEEAYRLFSTSTKKLGPVISFDDECGDGEGFIGVSKSGMFISSAFKPSPSSTDGYDEATVVFAINSINPVNAKKTALLRKGEIPFEVRKENVFYVTSVDSVFFLGDRLARYDVKNKVFTYVDQITDSYLRGRNENVACFGPNHQGTGGDYHLLDFNTNKITVVSVQACDQVYEVKQKEVPFKEETLKFPAGLEVGRIENGTFSALTSYTGD